MCGLLFVLYIVRQIGYWSSCMATVLHVRESWNLGTIGIIDKYYWLQDPQLILHIAETRRSTILIHVVGNGPYNENCSLILLFTQQRTVRKWIS